MEAAIPASISGTTVLLSFGIFRGTLKYNTLIATLQLADQICNVGDFRSDEELNGMSLDTLSPAVSGPGAGAVFEGAPTVCE